MCVIAKRVDNPRREPICVVTLYTPDDLTWKKRIFHHLDGKTAYVDKEITLGEVERQKASQSDREREEGRR